MKTLKLITLGIILFAASTSQAQVSVNVNIGRPPAWAPVGYAEAEYYYLPDVEAYYDVRATQFIYYGNGRWIHSRNLPGRYRNYDLYGGYKVVLNDYHGSRPYNNFRNHKIKYYKGYHGNDYRNNGYNNNRRVYVSNRHDNRRKYDNHKEYKKHENDRKGDREHRNNHGRHDRD